MTRRCDDCGRPLGTDSDLTRCADDCTGCKVCVSLCWRHFNHDTCRAPRRRRLIGWRVRWEWQDHDRKWRSDWTNPIALTSAWGVAKYVRSLHKRRNVRVMRIYRRSR